MEYKTLKLKLRNLDHDTYKKLLNKCKVSKNFYNQSLYEIRKYFFETGKYKSYEEMDKIMKKIINEEGNINYYLMNAQPAQQTLKRLDKNFKSFFAANKDFKIHPGKYSGQPKIPKYIKLDNNKKEMIYYNIIYTFQNFRIKGDMVQLEKGILIKLPKDLKDKKIKTIEIIPKNKYLTAHFVYEDIEEYKQIESNNNIMGMDLGVNNLAACVTNLNLRPFIINGRPLKSMNQFLNKEKAKLQSILKKRNNNFISKMILKLQEKNGKKINDYLHKISYMIELYCLRHKISRVFIGGVTKGMTKIAKNSSKKNNQNFVQIKLGQFISFIRYKLERHGIEISIVNEAYTSKCSFIDNEGICKHKKYVGKRIHRGLFQTAYNRLINADINGAANIIKKAIPNIKLSQNGIEALFRPYKLTI